MRLFVLAGLALALLAGNSFSKWEIYGLKGKEITSLATGNYFGDTMLLAGTKSEGVFVQYKRTDTFNLLTRVGVDTVAPAIQSIHSLFMQANPSVPVLYAGTDSGLYDYRFTSGSLPRWYAVNGIPQEPVLALAGKGDSLFAATRSEIYRCGQNPTAAWQPCSSRTFLPAMQRLTTFSSLSLFQGINAGSTMSGALSSWWGVLNSGDFGKSWVDASELGGMSVPRISSVFSLATYTPDFTQGKRICAGTNTGIFWTDNYDTGTWHACNPQLTTAPAKHLYVSYHTRSEIADIFALTDSGVCILSALVKSGEWVLSYPGKANAVISLVTMDTKEWFAATSDGVYRFTLDNAGVLAGAAYAHADNLISDNSRARLYSINGRAIGLYDKSKVVPHGVYLVKKGTNMWKMVR